MTRPPFDRYTAPRHAVAASAAAIALAVGVALLATSSGGGGSGTHSPRPAATPASELFPHSPGGAVAAATAWCQDTTQAFFSGTWDAAVSALATGAFKARAERYQPASAMVHSRMAAWHTPFAVRLWPLGYAVQQYSPSAARVRVWQLLVLGISGPLAQTTFYTTTVSVRWTGGDWKIIDSPPGPDLRPPARTATTSQVASWITSINQLRDYTYAP